MEIILKRIYMKEDCTVGCLQILQTKEKACQSPPPLGEVGRGPDTLESHAIPWRNKPLIGQKAGTYIRGQTAIPEGRYRVVLQWSPTFKRMVPYLLNVPYFTSVALRTGKQARQTRRTNGSIKVGYLKKPGIGHPADNPVLTQSHRVLDHLIDLIDDAIKRGEEVWLTVRSPKGWTTS